MKEDIKLQIESIKKNLISSSKEKILGLSTTADLSNPEIIMGSPRETENVLFFNILFRNTERLKEIIEEFDGLVDYFFLDCEVKNEVCNLEELSRSFIRKSKMLSYKPNDITIESLDVFTSILFGSFLNKNVFILGLGNVGSKTALKLSERGANVFVFDKDLSKAKTIVSGFNLIKKNNKDIKVVEQIKDVKDIDLFLSCAPGVPVVNPEDIRCVKTGGVLVDVGNRNLTPESIEFARENSLKVLSLSSIGGFKGFLSNWEHQKIFFDRKNIEIINGYTFIVSGVVGAKGDILVDGIENPKRVIGVCDGLGGLLPKDLADGRVREIIANTDLPSIINNVFNNFLKND